VPLKSLCYFQYKPKTQIHTYTHIQLWKHTAQQFVNNVISLLCNKIIGDIFWGLNRLDKSEWKLSYISLSHCCCSVTLVWKIVLLDDDTSITLPLRFFCVMENIILDHTCRYSKLYGYLIERIGSMQYYKN
jgi:hypothetical protein